jgi:hypothetical protein
MPIIHYIGTSVLTLRLDISKFGVQEKPNGVDGVVHLGPSAFESFSYMSPGATAKRLQKRLRIVAIQGFLQYIHVVQWHRHRYSTRQKTLQGAPGSRSKARKILLSH